LTFTDANWSTHWWQGRYPFDVEDRIGVRGRPPSLTDYLGHPATRDVVGLLAELYRRTPGASR
jgi:hypothetical protein